MHRHRHYATGVFEEAVEVWCNSSRCPFGVSDAF